ncbi:MvaI/BcnI family restriction endonuclease [Bifidobacterium mongoliense]|uniref:MvaI/BcnI family restriction endonuclease n=1 Tax=Bifidobacterium mongoliense TaxID=518643 RepID=UPI0030EDFC4F
MVHRLLVDAHADSVWVKGLGRNNNSKQQVYLAGDPSDLSFLPLGAPAYTPTKSHKPKASAPIIQIPVAWRWVTPDGTFEAPHTRLCYYPQYPEVRLSGFLRGCREAPSELMGETRRGHEAGRCLFLGPVKNSDGVIDHVVGIVVGADSPAAKYAFDMQSFEPGRLCPVIIRGERGIGEFSVLQEALLGIVGRRITPWRLRGDGSAQRPYIAPNAPGFTLEAELGVGENAIPGPDFDIWELKAIKQPTLARRYNHKVTLFTPQPDRGWITEHAQSEFVLKYGHVSQRDQNGNAIGYYFTTRDFRHENDNRPDVKLKLTLIGFTDDRNFDPDGMIALIDTETGETAAGWSFLKLLDHWQRKHNRAAYVPYLREDSDDSTFVEFGPLITLGVSTSFGLFLQAMKDGKVVYDPGDKATLVNGKWVPHSRSQFRINLNHIAAIYQEVRSVDIRDDGPAAS